MPFKYRLLTLVLLWLLAGTICALFVEGTVEAGESEFLARLQLVYLAPLISAPSVAFTLIHRDDGGTVSTAWAQRQQLQSAVGFLLLMLTVIHAIAILGLRTRRQFIVLSAIQAVYLALSVPSVLYCFHYEATQGHG